MSNKSNYKKFAAKLIDFPLDDEFVLQLKRPKAAATIDLRKYMDTLGDDEADKGRMLKVSARALGHCIAGNESWNEEELEDLIVMTGGEVGALSMKAMELCGLPTQHVQKALDDIGEDPSLSPGATE